MKRSSEPVPAARCGCCQAWTEASQAMSPVASEEVSEPAFRFVCPPSSLEGAPAGWAREMLRDGEIALLGDEGLAAVHEVAHELGQTSILLVRSEADAQQQDATVIAYARSVPIVWVADAFSENVRRWARERGPMTLLVETDGPLPVDERKRIDRFVAHLGRQSE
jgi:hypothetical protein